jgi:heme exporter protein C
MKYIFALVAGVATLWSFHIPPALGFQQPELARIFVWHFPCPIIASVLLMIAGWFAWKHLRTKDRAWDERTVAAIELSFVFSLLTMATGILFSEVQWGKWWSWDPRQTSFLIVLFIYAGYFIVRAAFSDPETRAANSGAYLLAAILPALFLIFVFPRLPQAAGLHPSDSILSGKIKGEYGSVVITLMALMTVLTVWMYRLRVRAGLLELNNEKSNERLAIRGGDSAPSGVVRRVSLPPEG